MSLDVSQYVIAYPQTVEPISWNPRLPDHLSPSSLTMFRRCPMQFQRRYIFGEKERPAEAPVIGSAVHAALELNFAAKIESHVDWPTHELLDWYSDVGWKNTVEREQERSGAEILWDTDPENAMRRGRIMLGAYHNKVAPRIQPTSVEGSVSVDFGAPVPVVGRFDIEREVGVIDVKTGKRAQKKPKEAWRIQAAVYGEAANKPVEFHSLTSSDSRSVSIVTPLESEALLLRPSENERTAIRANVLAIAHNIAECYARYGPEDPWPQFGTFHDWACGYCGWRPICPAWDE